MRSIVCLALSIALPLGALAGTPLPDAPHVVATGEGKVSAMPDSARIQFAFDHTAARPLVAKQQVDVAVNAFLNGLDQFAVDEADVRASELSASEDIEYDKGRKVSNGFNASREVTVLLKDLSKLNDFLDYGLGAGANGVSDVTFIASNEKQLREQAKRMAVADARARADGLATAFGSRLGPVYSVNSLRSGLVENYGATTLDRIEVTGSRYVRSGRYLQSNVDYSESVQAVFELQR